MERRLAAIMFADVIGSCRLMAADELRTLTELKLVYETIIRPQVDEHRGRIIRSLGDGLFVEFASVVDAVTCAARIQRAAAERARLEQPGAGIRFRIGIHFGDVVVDGPDLVGNGVNVAARIEARAPEGGILVSEKVFEEVKGNIDVGFRFAGTHRLKNIPVPVSVYEVRLDDADGDGEPAGPRRAEAPAEVPARVPQIALLPLEAIGEGAQRQVLVSGLSDDLTFQLSRFSDISIIASYSAQKYADADASIPEIGQELGADFLVNGNVICSDDRLRLFIRLFETSTGALIWSDRYDCAQADIFTLQDEIARNLASRLPLRIERAGLARIRQKPTYSLDAYECFLRGRDLYRMKSPEADREAISYLEKAIGIDPEFADPYAVLGAIRGIRWAYSAWGIDPSEDIAEGRRLIERALELNGELPRAHSHLGWTYLSTRDFDRAIEHLNIGVSLNPNDVDVLLLKAYALCYMGEPEESIRICGDLMRLNPRFPQWYMDVLATAQFVAGRYADSLRTYEKVRDLFPENLGWMAACQAHLDQPQEARMLAEQFVDRIRGIWKGPAHAGSKEYIDWWLHTASPFKYRKDIEALAGGIRMAGLPA